VAAPVWQPGTIYIPGDLVQPVSGTPAAGQPIVNPLITGSATGWTLPAQFSYDGAVSFTAGSGSIRFNTVGNGFFQFAATAGIAVSPGQSITASCMFQQGASDSGNLAGTVNLFWYNSGDVLIGNAAGNIINSGSGGAWSQSTVTAVAPAGAAFVRIGGSANRVGQNLSAWFDNFTWNYTGAGTPAGLIYKAVQPASGVSGSQEPVWPSVLGVQVVDNTVTWEAIAATRVTWKATPALVSGGTEPVWPTQIGESVSDGTIKWTAFSRRVEDVNCPNSKVVAIVQSKVFAADGDIVRFCATANPLDWTTERDAGYLPTGLQQANANDMAVLNQYRSNLVAFNASSFQNWQADPDPEVMAILDQMDGVGSTWQQAARPVGNELFYLSQLGVRTVGIAGASTNLQAGDVGMPVDPLVQAAIFVAEQNDSPVRSTYYPSAGQYWLAFSSFPPAEVTVAGDLPDAMVASSGTFQYVASGGVGVKTFAITAGALPPGATMSANGLVTFTYTTTGTFSWEVTATDALGSTGTLQDSNQVSGGAVMATNLRHYTGEIGSLVIASSDLPWVNPSLINMVALSPDGFHLFGSAVGNVTSARMQILKYNSGTNSWSALPAPAVLPTVGPEFIDWHPSGNYVAIGVNVTAERVFVYQRSGDTFTKIAAPSVIQANQSFRMKWSPDGTRLACSNANTAQNLWVYDFDPATGAFSKGRTVASPSDQTNQIAWIPGQSRYLVRGNLSNMTLIDTNGVSLSVVATQSLSGLPSVQSGLWFVDPLNLVTLGPEIGANGPVMQWTVTPSLGASAFTFVGYPADKTTAPAPSNKQGSLNVTRGYLSIARNVAAQPNLFTYSVAGGVLTQYNGIPTAGTGTVTSVSWRGEK
jgi:hypothetical protein